ncbi:MAG: CHAT domain-containing protein [Nitrospirae bacterium]|nr:CHAT domain-containing protein [Nitrospirota bacterium]
MEEKTPDIQKILDERAKLDSLLQSQFSKKVAVMFTDIKGSTMFYESRGDIDGRVMVHRHNEIVLPAIKENKSLFIKTIGDGTMSVFDDPLNSIKSAMDIQKKLRAHNSGKSEDKQIRVRIGMNYGTGIVEEKDVHGDVVNVASRIESIADADEILLTGEMYKEVKNNDELIFRYVDSVKVKGKKDDIKVFRLLWHEEALYLGKTRKADETLQKKEGVFVIEASVYGNQLKVSGFERTDGEEMPVKSYTEVRFNEIRIKDYTKGIIELLNSANRRGKIGNELLVKLKEYGRLLFDELIPAEIKDKLVKTNEKNLMVSIDDKLVHIPWELLYDGMDFFCQRFSLGRSVSTRQTVSVVRRAISRPLKMQILADPRGNLKASYEEGVGIKDEVGKLEEWLDVFLKTTDIKTDYVKAKIRNFDIVHYAGHAEHSAARPEESGWLLKDGKLSAEQILNMTGVMPMPSLVFSNACQTGQTEEWKLREDYVNRIFGLANAFLLSGVQHYIGTFWEIPDEAGLHFAKCFYENLVKGVTIGEALRLSRYALIRKYGEDTIVWASYMLYGDPTTKYIVPDSKVLRQESEVKSDKEAFVASDVRNKEEIIQFPQEKKAYGKRFFAGLGLLLFAGLVLFMMKWNRTGMVNAPVTGEKSISAVDRDEARKRIDELVASLAKNYREGNFEQAKAVQDEWSTKPVTMVVMDIKSPEDSGDHSREKLISLLSQFLQTSERINMVEREILVKLLEELKLSSSALADPLTALKIGKALSARIIVTGNIIPDKKGQTIMLRFIDTETTAIKKVISAESPDREINKDNISNIGRQIVDWVKEDFPVRGRLVSITGDKCQINLGQMHGIKKGDRLDVINESPKDSGRYKVIGEIEISESEKDKSQAVVLSRTDSIKEGFKVRAK